MLSDIVSADQPRRITPQVILEATATSSASPSTSSAAPAGAVPWSPPARSSMYVFRKLTDFSYPAIAREFGGRDHTTVMHAVDKITGLMKERHQIYDQVTDLIVRIKSGAGT